MGTEAQDMADTVSSWLQYKSLTGFRNLFYEASLTVPVTELLVSRYGTEIDSEINHPVLQKEKKKGRQAQIDFVRKRRSSGTWHSAYECKFQTADIFRIIYDLCRLATLSQADGIGNPRRRFIYAAKLSEDGLSPLKRSFNHEQNRYPRFQGILLQEPSEVGESLSFSICGLPEPQCKPFRVFSYEYKVRIPSKFRIELSGYARTRDFFCGVWTVYAAQGSVLKSHKELLNC